jgi:FKBP-type peptidyl-prolyl cis-trans isomerase (trigger factor)
MSDKTLYSNLIQEDKDDSEIELSGEIPSETFLQFRTQAIKKLGSNAKIDGFRAGHIPENILVDRLGENVILEEAAEMALRKAYPQIIADNKLDPIGSPQITLTKLAKDNPLGFKIKTAVMPQFELPDYREIAKEKTAMKDIIEVAPDEIEKVVLDIRKTRYLGEKKQKGEDITDIKEVDEKDLPEFTEEDMKSFGDFSNMTDFKKHIGTSIAKEKEMHAREKKRAEISEVLVEKTDTKLPDVIIESEISKMFAQLKGDLERAHIPYEDYLKQIKKTEEDLKKEWRETAVKRAVLQLVLNKIATEEKIQVEKEVVDQHVKHIMEHHEGTDEDRARIYVVSMLTNNLVYEFLESQNKSEDTTSQAIE